MISPLGISPSVRFGMSCLLSLRRTVASPQPRSMSASASADGPVSSPAPPGAGSLDPLLVSSLPRRSRALILMMWPSGPRTSMRPPTLGHGLPSVPRVPVVLSSAPQVPVVRYFRRRSAPADALMMTGAMTWALLRGATGIVIAPATDPPVARHSDPRLPLFPQRNVLPAILSILSSSEYVSIKSV